MGEDVRIVGVLAIVGLLVAGSAWAAEDTPAQDFTGVWKVIPWVVGASSPSPSGFDVTLKQTGAKVTGTITPPPRVQIDGTANGNYLTATITRDDVKTTLTLTMDPTRAVVTGTLTSKGTTTVIWVGTRSP